MSNTDQQKKPLVRRRVVELRHSLDMSQEKFAESIDVSTNTISRIEQGKISLSSDVAMKIAKVHGVSLDWLFYLGEERECPKHRKACTEALECIKTVSREQRNYKISK